MYVRYYICTSFFKNREKNYFTGIEIRISKPVMNIIITIIVRYFPCEYAYEGTLQYLTEGFSQIL